MSLGWTVLLAITYLLERPLLQWSAPLLGASWFPTAQLAFACCALAMSGWVTGCLLRRWHGFDVIPTVFVFGAILLVWRLGPEPAIDFRWVFRLLVDSFGNPRYLQSLITALATDALLYGSLLGGAVLSRAAEK